MERHLLRPLAVDIILFNPAAFNRCMDCEFIWSEMEPMHREHLEAAVATLSREEARDYMHFSKWINSLLDRYPNHVDVRIIDAISVEGITKSRQFGINYYPAVIINHCKLYSWQNLDEANMEIERIMSEYELDPVLALSREC